MKKIILTMLVAVVSLSAAGLSMGLTKSPPASVCLHAFGPGLEGGHYALIIKPSGSIRMLDGAQKFYSIQGAVISLPDIYCPLVGAGYVVGDVFHFTLNSAYYYSGKTNFVQAEGFWDLTDKAGSMNGYFSISGSSASFTLEQLACTGEDIVMSQQNGISVLLKSK